MLRANHTSLLKVAVYCISSLLLFFANCQAQNNSCGLHAQYAPSRDTFSTGNINLSFINFSTGYSSFQWLLDGYPYYYTTPVPDTFQIYISSVGIHKIQLAVSNGLCSDTATSYVIITGNTPSKAGLDNMIMGIYDSHATDFSNQTPISIDTLPGNNFLISGNAQNTVNLQQLPQQGFMMSIGQQGCVNWAKQVSAYYNTTIRQSIRCANGDMLSLCIGANYSTVPTTMFLIRTTQSGNLIWAKGLDAVLDIGFIKEDADQNICLLGTANTNLFTIGYFLLKMDNNGNILWTHLLQNSQPFNSYNYSSPTDVVQIGQYYYVSGSVNLPGQLNAFGFLSKFKIGDGSHIWTNLYVSDSTQNTAMLDLHPIANQLLINIVSSAQYSNPSPNPNPLQMYCYADTNGLILKSFCIKPSSTSTGGGYGSHFYVLPNHDFYISQTLIQQTSLQPGTLVFYSFYRISHLDTLSWGNTFVHNRDGIGATTLDYNGGLMTLGSTTSPLINPVIPTNNLLLTHVDSAGNTNGSCSLSKFSGSLQPCTFNEGSYSWKLDTSITVNPVTVPVSFSDLYFFKRWQCPDALDSCSYLSLDGPLKACNLSNTYTYHVHHLPGCSYTFSPPAGVTVLAQTDTAVLVQFNKAGTFTLSAGFAAGCSPVKDSIQVLVNPLINQLSLGKDTTICTGTSITLNAGNGFTAYKWQDGSANSSLTVTVPGKYYVTVMDNCQDIASDTVIISASPSKLLHVLKNSSICNKDSLVLQAAKGYHTYNWLPLQFITIQDSADVKVYPNLTTTYTMTALDSIGCTVTDSATIQVLPIPVLTLPADTILCNADTLLLNAFQNLQHTNYLWQDGSVSPTFTVRDPGTYSVKVSSQGCQSAAASVVSYQFSPSYTNGKDTSKCAGDLIQFDLYFPGANYLWQDLSTSPTFTILQPGTYYCNLTDYCGSVTDTIVVTDITCDCRLQVPNAFSPNGDGINDDFRPVTNCTPVYYHLSVFDRDGQLLFNTYNAGSYWNGTFNGRNVPVGTYYYLLKVKGLNDTQYRQQSGSVTVLR